MKTRIFTIILSVAACWLHGCGNEQKADATANNVAPTPTTSAPTISHSGFTPEPPRSVFDDEAPTAISRTRLHLEAQEQLPELDISASREFSPAANSAARTAPTSSSTVNPAGTTFAARRGRVPNITDKDFSDIGPELDNNFDYLRQNRGQAAVLPATPSNTPTKNVSPRPSSLDLDGPEIG